ncbi:hypothetical protein RJ55_03944 [Drechmeria coniospora]|nr:hypothetical protein RJ55_03944 [Drechmeria coniospora]
MWFHLLGLAHIVIPLALASIARPAPGTLQSRAGDKPGLPHDQRTTPHCSFWLDYNGSQTCAAICDVYGCSVDAFLRWNPSVGSGCTNLLAGKSYCVEAMEEPTVTSKVPSDPSNVGNPHPESPAVPIVETTTTTEPPNGIKTPSPLQPGVVGNCDKFAWVNGGDTCKSIAVKYNIPLREFLLWNSQEGEACSGLWAGTYACVSVIGYTPTPVVNAPVVGAPGNGIQTPTPTQPGMVSNCNRFRYVKPDENCIDIASNAGISFDDLARWNPSIGAACEGLWAKAYVCVGVLPAFRLKTRYHADCTGEVKNDIAVADGICINTACSVASLEIAAEGYCPEGQVQISYWEQADCSGKWFGYGYANKGQCRTAWSEGWKFKSLHFRCARKEEDCVSQQTCQFEPEPANSLC